MLCVLSLIFILLIAGALEADYITVGQAIIAGAYGLIMFYKTSKKYWN